VSNLFILYSAGFRPAPFYLWQRLTVVPHQFQDNVEIKMNLESFGQESFEQGFHVFDFHPIHVFLNTESLDRYERTRKLHQNPKELIKYRYAGYGTRSRLIELLKRYK
jgi:pyruvate-formate lyase-activating enzyme